MLVTDRSHFRFCPMSNSAVVVGAGVVGLATAWQLTQENWKVAVVYSKPGEMCVSVGAGAIWEFPPFSVEPQALAQRWLMASLRVFERFAESPDSGVVYRRVQYHYRGPTCKIPNGVEGLRGFRHYNGTPEEKRTVLPPTSATSKPKGIGAEFRSGYWYEAPVIHMRTHLGWMKRRLQESGVEFIQHEVRDLTQPLPEGSSFPTPRLVVNCAGLGGGSLCGDDKVYPLRGSMVFVRCPGLEDVITDDDLTKVDLCYIVPQRDGIVALAGCAERDNQSETVDEAEQKRLITRCEVLVPGLKGAEVVGTWAGLRPSRQGGIRLEVDPRFKGARVIHNYGHGGSGVVVAWGCAETVASLAKPSRL